MKFIKFYLNINMSIKNFKYILFENFIKYIN